MRKTASTSKSLSCSPSPSPLSLSWFSSATVILLLLWIFTSCVMSCPKVCQCNTKEREMVCHKAKLSDITFKDLDPPPQHLILDHISGMDALSLQDLLPIKDNLSTLKIRDGPLKTIPDRTFVEFKNLEDLDLSGNKLTSFKTESFLGLSYLQSLNIANNRLVNLGSSLSHLRSLLELDVSHNFLEEVPEVVHSNQTTLMNLPPEMLKLEKHIYNNARLQMLNLSYNRIDSIDPSVLAKSGIEVLDISHNNIHSLSEETLNFMDQLVTVNLHQNAWVCDCHIKVLSRWLRKSSTILKMHCASSNSESNGCSDLRCAAPSQLKDKLLTDLEVEDITGCPNEEHSDSLPASTQGAIVASCMGFAVILLIITIHLWKRGKTRYALKRVCVPSDAESSHVVDEDSKVPPLSNCDRVSLNESDHSFVVRHYFDTLVTDPKLMSRTSDSEEPTSPKERDSLYSSQPSLYTGDPNNCAPLGIESTV